MEEPLSPGSILFATSLVPHGVGPSSTTLAGVIVPLLTLMSLYFPPCCLLGFLSVALAAKLDLFVVAVSNPLSVTVFGTAPYRNQDVCLIAKCVGPHNERTILKGGGDLVPPLPEKTKNACVGTSGVFFCRGGLKFTLEYVRFCLRRSFVQHTRQFSYPRPRQAKASTLALLFWYVYVELDGVPG